MKLKVLVFVISTMIGSDLYSSGMDDLSQNFPTPANIKAYIHHSRDKVKHLKISFFEDASNELEDLLEYLADLGAGFASPTYEPADDPKTSQDSSSSSISIQAASGASISALSANSPTISVVDPSVTQDHPPAANNTAPSAASPVAVDPSAAPASDDSSAQPASPVASSPLAESSVTVDTSAAPASDDSSAQPASPVASSPVAVSTVAVDASAAPASNS